MSSLAIRQIQILNKSCLIEILSIGHKEINKFFKSSNIQLLSNTFLIRFLTLISILV